MVKHVIQTKNQVAISVDVSAKNIMYANNIILGIFVYKIVNVVKSVSLNI